MLRFMWMLFIWSQRDGGWIDEEVDVMLNIADNSPSDPS